MKPLTLTVEQSRELDRRAFEDYGIPTLLLMENAARTLAETIQRLLIPPIDQCHVVFICGAGNNGGDGFAAARHLFQQKIKPVVFLLGKEDHMSSDAAVNFRIIKNLGLSIFPFSEFDKKKEEWDRQPVLMVDALLGTGFKTPVRPHVADAIQQMARFKKNHTSTVRILSVDLPSGLNGDLGPVGEDIVPANFTATFACLKPGLVNEDAKPYAGRVEVIDIGIPDDLIHKIAG